MRKSFLIIILLILGSLQGYAQKKPRYEIADFTLDAAVVKPKPERYRRKDNPAVDLIRKVIADKDKNRPEGRDYYHVEEYDKLTLAINNYQLDTLKNRKLAFTSQYLDTSQLTGKPVLTVSLRESISDIYHRKSPKARKHLIKAKRTEGIDKDLDPNGALTSALENLFRNIDIYKNDIELFATHFQGPLSGESSILYYKYFIEDTVYLAGTKCILVNFVPASSTGYGFTGRLYIADDDSHSLRKCVLQTPKNLNLNWVDQLRFEQEFAPIDDSTYFTSRTQVMMNMSIDGRHNPSVYAVKTATFRGYDFEPNDEIFKRGDNTGANAFDLPGARDKSDEYWAANRHEDLSHNEKRITELTDRIMNIRSFKHLSRTLDVVASDWIPTRFPSGESKVDIGNMSRFFGYNPVEGFRMRFGARTKAALHPHIGALAYIAYGFRDKQFKYCGELTYSFNKMNQHFDEHLRHRIVFKYEHDIFSAEDSEFKDNIFFTPKLGKTTTMMQYITTGSITYEKEWAVGVTLLAEVAHKTYRPAGDVRYQDAANPDKLYWGFRTTPVTLGLRIAPGEQLNNANRQLMNTNKNVPIISLSHTYSPQNLFGADYRGFNRTDFSFWKRFWVAPVGAIDTKLSAGMVWDKVPFPLLYLPACSQSILYQKEVFHQMIPFEFVCDKYVTLDFTWRLKGAILDNIPGIKYLKWREVLTFNGIYGGLAAKNDPALNPEGLFAFPQGTRALSSKMPYMEVGVGIENIFRILSVHYFRRLSYLDTPGCKKNGFRIGLHVDF